MKATTGGGALFKIENPSVLLYLLQKPDNPFSAESSEGGGPFVYN